jgi:hypothetical protein
MCLDRVFILENYYGIGTAIVSITERIVVWLTLKFQEILAVWNPYKPIMEPLGSAEYSLEAAA